MKLPFFQLPRPGPVPALQDLPVTDREYESVQRVLMDVRGEVSFQLVRALLTELERRPGLSKQKLARAFEKALRDPGIYWTSQAFSCARCVSWEWTIARAIAEGDKVV